MIHSRRHFLIHSGGGLVGLSAASPWLVGARARAATSAPGPFTKPDWPKPPRPADASAGSPEKLGDLAAATEQKRSDASAPLDFEKRVGFAVVGLGHLSLEEILPAMAQSKMARVTALVSGDPEKAKRVAKQYAVPASGIYSYENFDRIAENPDVRVVYVVLPNSMHRDYTLRAAKAGKHVLCEKPMATGVAEADEMIQGCRRAGVKLMIAYRQQYEPYNRWIARLVREKTFGDVKFFDAGNAQNQAGRNGGQQQWRHVKAMAGGGALPDIGLYCLNAARFLSGEEPVEVQARIHSTPHDPRFKEVEETVAWMMRFPSGLIANCFASYGAHETKRYRFTAENGWFGMEPAFAYHGVKAELSYALGAVEHRETPSLPEKNQFALEMDHMASCVLSGQEPHTPGEEGRQDQRLMAAIYESAQAGKTVALPPAQRRDQFRGPSLD